MRKYLKGKMSISRMAFACAFYATITTIFEDYFHNRYIFGVFGGLVTIFGFMLAILIFRNDN
ncbi:MULTISPECIES: hypothetical protein [unclassified Bacillus (in: firmicutes)]|jgi:hypothetical protein|uniref:hypothetical protein n=1 Tax=unclassified Bacillus (in: firmicutes) TaxID=185979 RepID=UPI0008E96C72|nr:MULTISPECIES: hypothetical protein [unclassified Bacillus (in: firmicutes)]PGZ91284.1 hypothetical protein COE53_15075 [Bacillus sp. AFS029533]SFD12836.1 hypothetical protein SAMN02799633_02765 [Bacillus sp. UNCCL81]